MSFCCYFGFFGGFFLFKPVFYEVMKEKYPHPDVKIVGELHSLIC